MIKKKVIFYSCHNYLYIFLLMLYADLDHCGHLQENHSCRWGIVHCWKHCLVYTKGTVIKGPDNNTEGLSYTRHCSFIVLNEWKKNRTVATCGSAFPSTTGEIIGKCSSTTVVGSLCTHTGIYWRAIVLCKYFHFRTLVLTWVFVNSTDPSNLHQTPTCFYQTLLSVLYTVPPLCHCYPPH